MKILFCLKAFLHFSLPLKILEIPQITFLYQIVLKTAVSTLVGSLAPILIDRLGFDPEVMTGPLMDTAIDVSGLTIYFETAKFLIHLSCAGRAFT